MFALPASAPGGRWRRAGLVALISFAAAGLVAAAVERPRRSSKASAEPSRAATAGARSLDQPRRCPHRHQPLALVLVQLRSADLDLAHYLDADRPGGFATTILPFEREDAPQLAVTGDTATWRWVGVHMDRPAAHALASRLRMLPAIADARVISVSR
jgi:hypothetical protein